MQTFADVVFLIEGTALNGAYMNELKANYVVPTLEYFSQGSVEDRDYYLTDRFTTQYGIVLYRTAANLLDTMSLTFGPFTSPIKVMETIEKLPLIGGGIESCANMAEGLATAHVCFDNLYERRKCLRMDHINVQRHCILLCNSPPYSMPVMENSKYNGKTVEQLAALLHERRINLSIIAPRKIPVLYKLFMKADGDMPLTAKNQAKNIRHLVLLKGYSFKERSASPITNGMGPVSTQSHMAQMAHHQQQSNQTISMDTSPVHIQAQSIPMNGMNMPQQTQQFMPPGQNSGQLQNANFQGNMPMNQQNRWIYGPNQQSTHPRPTFIGGPVQGSVPGAQSGAMMNNSNINSANQNSALISQLSAPPNQSVNPLLQQQQLRLQMLNQQHMQQQQMNHQSSQQQQQQQQQQPQPLPHTSSNLPQTQSPHGPMGPVGGPSVPQVGGMPPAGNINVPNALANGPSLNQANVSNVTVSGQVNTNHANDQAVMRDREKIWTGVLEWVEKTKPDQQKISRTLQCTVSTNIKDGEPEIRSDNWPPKLLMQLMPKHLVGNIGGQYLKDSKMVVFRPSIGEALDALSKVMISGCAGIVHFTTAANMPACDIKVLVLLYTAEKNAFLGFIPNNQASFVDRLRKVIQQRQNATATGVPVGVGPHMPQQQQPGPTQQQQMNLLSNKMSTSMQNLPQNVLAAQQQMQQQNIHGQVETHQQHFNQFSGQMNMGPVPGAVSGAAAGVVSSASTNALHHQQQMSMMPSQQHQQQQQAQQRMGIVSGNLQQMAPHAVAAAAAAAAAMQQQQRMVRPMMSNNPGLRHLLQQQSAPVNQFRPQMGGVAGGPGGPGSGPGVSQMGGSGSAVANRPFDDSNYEYM